jgi:uncharacterized protein (TIGR02147 family)
MTSSHPPAIIDVFAYDNYRELLGDYYVKKKELQPYFSYRAFSRRTGFRAPNHLQRVINGDRNLSADAALRYSQAMHLDSEEQDYFCTLVEHSHASDEDEIRRLTEKLVAMRRYRGARRLDEAYAEYHSHWYIPAIFEMIACRGFVADPRWIAPRMRPPISEEEAARALSILRELRLVEESGGQIAPVDAVLTTGREARRRAIAEYHRTMLESAKASIDLVPSDERDISALTLCMSEGGLERLKQRIQAFRKELLSLSAENHDGEQVIQLNMQLFPLTKRCE